MEKSRRRRGDIEGEAKRRKEDVGRWKKGGEQLAERSEMGGVK